MGLFEPSVERDETATAIAALILHDDGMEVSGENIAKLLKAAGVSVEPYWPILFSKMLAGKDVGKMLCSGGGGPAGGAGGAGGAAAGGAAAGGAAAEEKKEEAVEEEEEEMDFDLFD